MIVDIVNHLRETRRGAMFVLDGPSGSGKNAIMEEIIKRDKNIKFSVSATTRKIREGESEGNPYYFLPNEEFDRLLEEDAFYEYVESDYGAKYGTLKSEVDSFITVGQDVLFDMDNPGLLQMKERAPYDVVSIGILPPSIDELYSRLVKRGNNDEASIKKRMMQTFNRLQLMRTYDYVIVNVNLEESVGKLQRIISGERMKRVRQIGLPEFFKQLSKEAKKYE
ncbi:MAG: guanylate kinase [Lactobacillus sp.]|jgi:guanylate kinase|nr:guanylate kinase [Lactobacillus sp.]